MGSFDDRLGSADTRNKFAALLEGTVADRSDPKGYGRVKVRVAGLFEPSTTWCWPMATVGGGSQDTGFFAVPEVGAEVYLMHVQADPDNPRYMCGHWGKKRGATRSETPSPDAPVGATATVPHPDTRVFATPSHRIVIDEKEGQKKITIFTVGTGDKIEIDAETNAINIVATSAINIVSDGTVDIQGLNVFINSRVVRPIKDPI